MSDSPETLDSGRRTWLMTTCAVGGAGAAAVAIPFVSSFEPSERAKAAGASVEVDISELAPGEKSRLSGVASRCGYCVEPKKCWPRWQPMRATLPTLSRCGRHTRHQPTRVIGTAQSNPSTWWWSAYARTWVAHRSIVSKPGLSRRCRTTGQGVSCARVMDQPLTLPGAYLPTSRPQTILKSRHTCISPIPCCSLVKTNRRNPK